jgi:8-oxo-dGTP pyrophosphatase MutT (NUDIX family)
MNEPAEDLVDTAAAPFSIEAFRRRASARLTLDPPGLPIAPMVPELGEMALNPEFTDLAQAEAHRPAAVLIPVIGRAGEATVVLTTRTAHLPSHAGEVAFPGGKVDPADSSPLVTALREAEEEIGLDRAFVTPVGYLDTYLTRTGYKIVPVVGLIEPGHPLTPNPHEVDEVFEVPLSFLMTPANHAIHSRIIRGAERRFYAMPWDGHYIWGVTAAIVQNLYRRVYGG